MTIAQSILPEFDHEMATTRTLLERVPDTGGDWKPHPRSMSLANLANHIATLPGFAKAVVQQTELDMNPAGDKEYTAPSFDSAQARLAVFDENVRQSREAIAGAPDSDMQVVWSLKHGDKTIFAVPRVAVLRTFTMNHIIHHRGQLSVYLRLLDIPLPSIYGPTADTAG